MVAVRALAMQILPLALPLLLYFTSIDTFIHTCRSNETPLLHGKCFRRGYVLFTYTI